MSHCRAPTAHSRPGRDGGRPADLRENAYTRPATPEIEVNLLRAGARACPPASITCGCRAGGKPPGGIPQDFRIRACPLSYWIPSIVPDGRQEMTVAQILLMGLYVPMACLLALYGVHRAMILAEYLRTRRDNPRPEGSLKELPTVLVQIPIFNERAVLPRILAAVAKLDYPRDKLRVQVLDDSTDDTVSMAREASTSSTSTARTATVSRRARSLTASSGTTRTSWRSSTPTSCRRRDT